MMIIIIFISIDSIGYQSLSSTQSIRFAYKSFAGEHFQQFQQHLAVAQVRVEVADAVADAHQMRIDPFLKRLLLHALSLVCCINKTTTTTTTID